jgi:hypothetical protein
LEDLTTSHNKYGKENKNIDRLFIDNYF